MKNKKGIIVCSMLVLIVVLLVVLVIMYFNKRLSYEDFMVTVDYDILPENSVSKEDSVYWDSVLRYAEANEIPGGEPAYYDTLGKDVLADAVLAAGFNECYIFSYWGEINVVVIVDGSPTLCNDYNDTVY